MDNIFWTALIISSRQQYYISFTTLFLYIHYITLYHSDTIPTYHQYNFFFSLPFFTSSSIHPPISTLYIPLPPLHCSPSLTASPVQPPQISIPNFAAISPFLLPPPCLSSSSLLATPSAPPPPWFLALHHPGGTEHPS